MSEHESNIDMESFTRQHIAFAWCKFGQDGRNPTLSNEPKLRNTSRKAFSCDIRGIAVHDASPSEHSEFASTGNVMWYPPRQRNGTVFLTEMKRGNGGDLQSQWLSSELLASAVLRWPTPEY
ncbi:MAG: hypothetical protein CMM00_09370 [Rhodopirellula sp.]|nr:hypothetical protein [Rhodopirellula sp.]